MVIPMSYSIRFFHSFSDTLAKKSILCIIAFLIPSVDFFALITSSKICFLTVLFNSWLESSVRIIPILINGWELPDYAL